MQVTATQSVKKLKKEHEREIREMRQLLLEPSTAPGFEEARWLDSRA